MPLYDLIIRNGTVVTSEAILEADIAIAGESIAAIEHEIEGTGSEEIDASGLHIFPGVIDAHLHFNEPGRADWEGFATGTSALAAGGTTLYFDMPLNAHPPTVDAAAFDLKLAAATASSIVDFGLWGGLVPGNIDQMAELAERGVVGFKAFMSNSGIDDFDAVDDLALYDGMARAAELGSLVAVHAESDTLTSLLARRAIAEGKTGVRDYLQSRPVVAELEAIERAILFAAETGCALHIVHVSTGRGVALVAEAYAHGINVSCETCAHYLALTEDDVERLGAVAKCAPPLRAQHEQDALWLQIHDGTLQMVTSDHSPAPASMKTGDDFFKIWGGISGCQSLLSVLLTDGHAQRKLALTTIARIMSDYAAHRFKLPPTKGRIAPDADADLVLVDLSESYTLQANDLLYRHKQSPYTGKTFQGKIVQTLLRGRTVYANGNVVTMSNGKLVRPGREA
ncbi:MAG: allantoinase [Chloroflexota bacterium]